MEPDVHISDQQYADMEARIKNMVVHNSKSVNELYSVIGRSTHYSSEVKYRLIKDVESEILLPQCSLRKYRETRNSVC